MRGTPEVYLCTKSVSFLQNVTSARNAFWCIVCAIWLPLSAAPLTDSTSWIDLGKSSAVKPTLLSHGPEPITLTDKDWEGKNLSLADLLAQQTGIQTRSLGGTGSFQQISIRGMGGHRVVVTLDGVPIGDGDCHGMNLGSIDLNQLEKVIIHKAHAPVELGGNSLGGVVELISRQKAEGHGRIFLGYGSYHTGDAALSVHSALHDSLDWSSNLSWRFADNDYPYYDRNGTPYNTDDDQWRHRQNAEFRQLSGTHHFKRIFPKFQWNWHLLHQQSSSGYPGTESDQAILAGTEEEKFSLKTDLQRFWGSQEQWSALLGMDASWYKSLFHWSNKLDHLGYTQGNDDWQEVGHVSLQAKPSLALRYEKRVYEWGWHLMGLAENMTPRDKPVTAQQWRWELNRRQILSVLDGAWRIQPWLQGAISHQITSTHDRNSGGILKLTWIDTIPASSDWDLDQAAQFSLRLLPEQQAWQAHLTMARHYRLPALTERYGTSLGIIPNPELKPESGWKAELGTQIQCRRLQAQITGFWNTLRQGIVWVQAAGFAKPVNIGQSRTYGLELSVKSQPTSWLHYSWDGTWQSPRNQSTSAQYHDKQLPGEPKLALNQHATLQLPFHLSMDWALRWQSQIYRDQANQQSIPRQHNQDITLTYTPWNQAKLSLALQNLEGEEYQNVYSAYPTPGRQYHLSWSQQF